MIRVESWYREAETLGLQFEEAVETYRRTRDFPDLMRVLTLSLRSGSGLSEFRSPQSVRARELLLDYGLVELREALPEDVHFQVIPPFEAPLGKVGPNLHVTLERRRGRRNQKFFLTLRVYPLIQHTLEKGTPTFSLTDVHGGGFLGIDFRKTYPLQEVINILRGGLE